MNSNKNKRYIIIGAAVLLILLAVLGVLTIVLAKIASNTKAPQEADFDFYEPDYNLNIEDYPEYLEKDRNLYYTNEETSTRAVTEENFQSMGEGPEFFYNYINAIKNGDHETYNAMLHEDYIKEHGTKEKFTAQMLYDIELEYIYKQEVDDNTDAVVYKLNYFIYRNDGTFRRDIGDGSRTQFITVFFNLKTGEGKIHSLQNEYTVIK